MKRTVSTMVGAAAGILLAMFLVMGFLLYSCGSSMQHAEQSRAAAEAATPTVQLGQSFDVGGLSVTDMEVRLRHDLGSDGIFDTSAKGIYVVVLAHVTNDGTKARGLDSMYQKLHIGAREYQGNPFANVGAGSSLKTSVYVDPGFSDDVAFIFDVPKSSVSVGTTGSFTDTAVLDVSAGLVWDAPKPDHVKVAL